LQGSGVVRRGIGGIERLRHGGGHAHQRGGAGRPPVKGALHGAVAEAYQVRYLARRAVTAGAGDLAFKLAGRTLSLSLTPLVEEPLKTITTLGAATVLRIFGADTYRKAQSSVLRLKNA
jgi:hypothetical protein